MASQRALLLLCAVLPLALGFMTQNLPLAPPPSHRFCTRAHVSMTSHQQKPTVGRREMLKLAIGGAALITAAPDVCAGEFMGSSVEWYRPDSVPGELPTYTGEEWKGPRWPKPTDENSISWKDFLKLLQDKDVVVVDFIGKNGEKVYAWRKSATPEGAERIRIGEGLPDETTPPPPSKECSDCLAYCKTVKKAGVPFRYSYNDDKGFANPINLWRKWVMFDGPISAGII